MLKFGRYRPDASRDIKGRKTSDKSSTDRSRSLVDETPPHLAWSESLLQLAVVPDIETWTYTGALGQLSWLKNASTGRYRLNRKWKYGGNMRNRFHVNGFLFDPNYIKGSICDRFGCAHKRPSLENVWPRFSRVVTVEFACNFHE